MKYLIYFLIIAVLVVVAFFLSRSGKEIPKEEIIAKKIKKSVEEKTPIEIKEVIIEPKEIQQKEVWTEIDSKIATGNPYRKQEAIEALVSIGDEASVKIIETLTEDKTPSVVNYALIALGELKSKESIPLIEKVFEANRIREDGYGESIRINAVDALGAIGSPQSINMLGSELEKKNVSFGSHIVEAMQKIGSAQALPYLEEYKTFLDEQLSNMPGAEEIGEYRYIWEQSAKQVKEAIDKLKEEQ